MHEEFRREQWANVAFNFILLFLFRGDGWWWRRRCRRLPFQMTLSLRIRLRQQQKFSSPSRRKLLAPELTSNKRFEGIVWITFLDLRCSEFWSQRSVAARNAFSGEMKKQSVCATLFCLFHVHRHLMHRNRSCDGSRRTRCCRTQLNSSPKLNSGRLSSGSRMERFA